MQWAKFLTALLPELLALARTLFERHRGNLEAAKIEIRNIRSRKDEIEADRREVDAEIEALKRERGL